MHYQFLQQCCLLLLQDLLKRLRLIIISVFYAGQH